MMSATTVETHLHSPTDRKVMIIDGSQGNPRPRMAFAKGATVPAPWRPVMRSLHCAMVRRDVVDFTLDGGELAVMTRHGAVARFTRPALALASFPLSEAPVVDWAARDAADVAAGRCEQAAPATAASLADPHARERNSIGAYFAGCYGKGGQATVAPAAPAKRKGRKVAAVPEVAPVVVAAPEAPRVTLAAHTGQCCAADMCGQCYDHGAALVAWWARLTVDQVGRAYAGAAVTVRPTYWPHPSPPAPVPAPVAPPTATVATVATLTATYGRTGDLAAYLARLVWAPKVDYATAYVAHLVDGAPEPAAPDAEWADQVARKVRRWARSGA